MIGLFFVFTTWLMIKGVGAENLQATLGGLEDPTVFFFDLTGQYVGGSVAMIAALLLISSLFAALSAFHNYVARYAYVAGRDGLLPAVFGRTHNEHQSPHIGSVAQTIGAVVVTGLFAVLQLDPILNYFTWISQIGVLGVLGMMAVTSIAIIAFFRRQGGGSPLTTLILPSIAAMVMAALFIYVFVNFGDLTGTSGGALGWILPGLIPLGAAIGWLMAARLRGSNVAAYAVLGQSQT
jgi:amino acid transporter